MILVDTSIWIRFFGRNPGPRAIELRDRLGGGLQVAITGLILQEVLQGARSEEELARLRAYLAPQRILHPRHSVLSYVEAARLYARCRWAGVTPRSSVDCLIAEIAIEHAVELLHDDRNFEHIGRVDPRLKFA